MCPRQARQHRFPHDSAKQSPLHLPSIARVMSFCWKQCGTLHRSNASDFRSQLNRKDAWPAPGYTMKFRFPLLKDDVMTSQRGQGITRGASLRLQQHCRAHDIRWANKHASSLVLEEHSGAVSRDYYYPTRSWDATGNSPEIRCTVQRQCCRCPISFLCQTRLGRR